MIPWLHAESDPLPDPRMALPRGSDAPGLLAAGGELSPRRLTEAYSHGVFPWYSAGQPILWWSPDPRMPRLQAFSSVHNSGCWCARANSLTWVTLVSATSRVNTPHTPFPRVCTCSMRTLCSVCSPA